MLVRLFEACESMKMGDILREVFPDLKGEPQWWHELSKNPTEETTELFDMYSVIIESLCQPRKDDSNGPYHSQFL